MADPGLLPMLAAGKPLDPGQAARGAWHPLLNRLSPPQMRSEAVLLGSVTCRPHVPQPTPSP